MAVIRLETDVDCSPDDAWKVLSNWGDLSWFPGVSRVEADEAYRVVTAEAGGVFREALSSSNDDTRTIVYSIVESPLALESHEATMSAIPDGLAARLVFSIRVEPDAAADVVRPIYEGALEGLRDHLTG